MYVGVYFGAGQLIIIALMNHFDPIPLSDFALQWCLMAINRKKSSD